MPNWMVILVEDYITVIVHQGFHLRGLVFGPLILEEDFRSAFPVESPGLLVGMICCDIDIIFTSRW